MNPISDFQITGLTVSGFKCYQNTTEFAFGNPTVITGGNGRGKSSIADAIAFAITGLPFFGERGIDRLHGEQNPNLYVSLQFADGNGQAHELTRSRRDGRMTITYDGYDIRQRDLGDLFGEKDVFLSIFNPLYFIEELGDDGRKLLERYLPAITHEQILAQLDESTSLALQNESILSPEVYLKNRREEIRDLEQQVVYLKGQRDLVDSQQETAKEHLRNLQERKKALCALRDELESKRFAGLDPKKMKEQLVELSGRYEEMARDSMRSAGAPQPDERLALLHQKLGQRKAEQYTPKYTQAIAEISARVKDLALRYQHEASIIKGLSPGAACPTCRRKVTETDFPAIQSAVKTSMDQILVEGRAQKAQLNELQGLEHKTEATFLQFQKDDVEQLLQEIAEIDHLREQQSQDQRAQNEQYQQELESIHTQIQTLTAELEFGNLSQAEYDQLHQCQEKLRNCEADLSAAVGAADIVTDSGNKAKEIAEIEQKIKEKRVLLQYAARYVSKRAEMTFSQLKMNKVEVSLFDVVKSTGEVKDTFKFTYGGRRYDRLSLSEKIRAGMEISELMKRLTGRNYPVFVDNMESVDDLANVRPTGQLIMAKCQHGTALSVRPISSMTMPKAA